MLRPSAPNACARLRPATPGLFFSAWLRPACMCKALSCDTNAIIVCVAATRVHAQGHACDTNVLSMDQRRGDGGLLEKCIVMCATRLVTNAAVSIIIIIIIIIIFILIYHTGINEVSNRYQKYH